jgi:flavin reductase (DIM6/NTAB) family NADH-FMN oxidoreductase RutF
MAAPDGTKQLAAALGRVPSGLFVLTARRGTEQTGMLVSWVQQCAFDPPHLTLALQRDRDLAGWLAQGTPFTINLLDDTQTDMIVHFGRGFDPGQPAFTGIAIEQLPEGGPVLTEALAYLVCQVAAQWTAGDHTVFLGRIIAGRLLNEGQPMVHVRKSGFHY